MLQVSLIEINNNFRPGEHQANHKNTCCIRERPVGIFTLKVVKHKHTDKNKFVDIKYNANRDFCHN